MSYSRERHVFESWHITQNQLLERATNVCFCLGTIQCISTHPNVIFVLFHTFIVMDLLL